MAYIKTVNKIKSFLLELFFPRFCFGCKKEGSYLCEDCRATLDISEAQYCLCNKNPLRMPVQMGILPEQKKNACLRNQGKCNRCRTKNLSGLYSALPYKENNLTKKLIYNFKYRPYVKELAKPLASLILEHLLITNKNTEDIWQDSALIPVPLDKNKLKKRGYNQSEELAKELSKVLNVPVLSDVLIKIKSTKPQMELSKEEREKNLQSVFAINKNFVRPELTKFSKIFLLDDVYTTGSTLEECAKTLKQANAKQVWGITIAREE